MTRFKCKFLDCKRYKFHLHCEDMSRKVKKEFHHKMKHYGTFERVSDVMKPLARIFEMIQLPPKRRYNRGMYSVYSNIVNDVEMADGQRMMLRRNPETGETERIILHPNDEDGRYRLERSREELFSALRSG